jgi:hypothetical protein
MKILINHRAALLLITGILFVLTGCGIPSVHPLYEQTDLQTNSSLQGVWQRNGSDNKYHVMLISDVRNMLERAVDSSHAVDSAITGERATSIDMSSLELVREYENRGLGNLYLVQSESNREDIYLAGYVSLGGNSYLDFKKLDFDVGSFRYPVHLFMKVSVEENQLTMHMFSDTWLKEQLQNRQIRIKYEVNDEENYLLTAPTRDLQKFVQKYGSIDQAYRNSQLYTKISDSPMFIFEEPDPTGEDE